MKRQLSARFPAHIISLALIILLGMDQSFGAEKTNLLFILTDNQPASIMGTYGNPDVRTPNIDALARDGVRFNHAYAVNGMCSPTRATLMTGLMPSQHGVHSWLEDEKLDEWPDDWSAVAEFRTLPLTLANRGYQTAMIGKWHLGQPGKPSIGYQHWITFSDGHTVDFWDNTVIDNGRSYRLKDQHIVDFFTDKALEYLDAYEGEKPFYLQLNYDGPYLNPPTNLGPARNRHYQSYVGKEFRSFPRVAFNQNVTDQLMDPTNTNEIMKGKNLLSLKMHNDPASMANVASQNTVVDDGVGRVLAKLKEKGLEGNTLVIFSSDQGNFYGQHGLWQHTVVTWPSSPYETPMNIPLIVKHPTRIPGGRVEESLIGQYDLPVTILDYLGIEDVSLENSPGRSFVSLLEGKADADAGAWLQPVYFEQEETRGMRTPRYTYWKRLRTTGQPALFDMQADPGQHINLAEDPDYGEDMAALDEQLTDFFSRYAARRYDLWNGGVAKGFVGRPEVFQALYGEDWAPEARIEPAFGE